VSESAQTLDRGLRLLHLVADVPGGLTVTEAAGRLGVGRAVVYRLAEALAGHGMLRRDSDGRLKLGPGVLHLARRAQPLLADAAVPVLRGLAERTGVTAHLTLADGPEGVAVAVVEPSWTTFHVAYRTGARHPLTLGAAGRAILAGRAAADGSAPGAAADGHAGSPVLAVSSGELQPGAHGVAAGVPGLEASVGIIALEPLDVDVVGPQVTAAAAALAEALR
jgi:hypothetical protein